VPQKSYRHQKRGDGAEITVLEEDENWILGAFEGYHSPFYNIFCKECLWFVCGKGAAHDNACFSKNKIINQLFLKKALFCAP
jgi:hypothetical protein